MKVIKEKIAEWRLAPIDGQADTKDAEPPETLENLAPPAESISIKSPQQNLPARRYRIKCGTETLYMVVSNLKLRPGTAQEKIVPYEVFLQKSKSADEAEWVDAVSLLITLALQYGIPVSDIHASLSHLISSKGGSMGQSISGRKGFVPSLLSEIGEALKLHENAHLRDSLSDADVNLSGASLSDLEKLTQKIEERRREISFDDALTTTADTEDDETASTTAPVSGDICPQSGCWGQLVHSAGCENCPVCGYSKCG